MTPVQCLFPNCPSGQNVKLLDERHEEVKTHLLNIQENQKEMIIVVKNVATLLSNVESIKDELKQKKADHDEIFMRLRKVENKVYWMIGIGGGAISLFEFLRVINILK